MTGRLADIEARIGSVHQLRSVIAAMRGIAAARTIEANRHLMSVRAYADTVGAAIGRALGQLDQNLATSSAERGGRRVIIVLTAEQGFAGSFSQRILDHAETFRSRRPGEEQDILLVGDRGVLNAAERGMEPDWETPMISSTGQATVLANRIMDALYERIGEGDVRRVNLIHARPSASPTLDIVEKQLVPFDFGRFPAIAKGEPPLLNLPAGELLESLTGEYVFAELCEAVILSYAAENEARMRAMIAAQQNVADKLDELVASSRRVRQEEITSEISELSASILPR